MDRRLLLKASLGLSLAPHIAQAQNLEGPPAQLISWPKMTSQYVAPHDVLIWLPHNYETRTKPLASLYVMDGQNGFSPSPYSGSDWGLAQTIPRLVAEGKIKDMIIIAISSGADRNAEYMPQKIVSVLPETYQDKARHFNATAPQTKYPISDAFLHFLITELKPKIETSFKVSTLPQDTAIIGASMGAEIALYAHGEYPDHFGASASLSMPWVVFDLAKDKGEIEANARILAAAYGAWLGSCPLSLSKDQSPHRLYMDQGTVGLDEQFTPYLDAMRPILAQTGWHDGRDLEIEIIAGGQHSEKDWKARLGPIMGFILPA